MPLQWVEETNIRGPQGPAGVGGTSGDAIAVYDAGNVPAAWTPVAMNGSRQRAVVAQATTISAPTDPPRDGFRLSITLTATGASRVVTLDGGISRWAGYPVSFQLPVGKVGAVRLEWNAAAGRWVGFWTQEA